MDNYISESEIDGNVKQRFIVVLGRFIRLLRSVYNIHCFFKGVHAKHSQHYKGLAADGHIGKFQEDREPTADDLFVINSNLTRLINKKNKSLFEQALLFYLSNPYPKGIGLYPHWKHPGLHTDIRDNNCFWIALDRKRIIKELKEQKGNQVYFYF